MSASELTFLNGRPIRPGFYRSPDGSGVQYANSLKASGENKDCVFCPEAIAALEPSAVTSFGTAACRFNVVLANPRYAHFDAAEVIDHKLIIPEAHIDSLRKLGHAGVQVLNDYLWNLEEENPEAVIQSYARVRNNPSKSIDHLHIHLLRLSLNPVSRFTYDMEAGVTDLDFRVLSDDEKLRLEQSRIQSSS